MSATDGKLQYLPKEMAEIDEKKMVDKIVIELSKTEALEDIKKMMAETLNQSGWTRQLEVHVKKSLSEMGERPTDFAELIYKAAGLGRGEGQALLNTLPPNCRVDVPPGPSGAGAVSVEEAAMQAEAVNQEAVHQPILDALLDKLLDKPNIAIPEKTKRKLNILLETAFTDEVQRAYDTLHQSST